LKSLADFLAHCLLALILTSLIYHWIIAPHRILCISIIIKPFPFPPRYAATIWPVVNVAQIQIHRSKSPMELQEVHWILCGKIKIYPNFCFLTFSLHKRVEIIVFKLFTVSLAEEIINSMVYNRRNRFDWMLEYWNVNVEREDWAQATYR
jgi:hypothetical protein